MTNRKSAKQWREAHQNAEAKLNRVENQITMRLLELMKLHPDVPVGYKPVINEKLILTAKEIDVIELRISMQLRYIEIIEKYLADQHPHQQQNLFVVPEAPVGERVLINGSTGEAFTKTDPICNCDGRDMPTYIEDGKRWCPQCGYEVQ